MKETNQFAAGFLILLPLIILGISFQDYIHYVNILNKGTYFTIEGIPQDCDTSSFRIDYVPFTFNGRISTSSYNGSRDGVKVLCSGARVRVAFTDMLIQDEKNAILRIEVQQ